jgi:hypothetical protein
MWLRVWVRTIALSIDSAETWGTYVSKYEDDSGDDTSYLVTYRFVVDDRVYVVEESVKEATYTSADNGESLPVRYVVHDPDIATIEPISFVGPLLLTAFCVVWCGLVFGAFFYNLYILLKWRRLARDGELTEGEIIHCSGEKDSDGDYHLKAEVRFRSPQTGEWLQGTYSPKRNDLKGKSLPGPGTRVHVIYLDDKTYEAL